MSDNVVFLAFENSNTTTSERDLLACSICKNKTYTARMDLGHFPTLCCAACGQQIGAFGWTEQESIKP